MKPLNNKTTNLPTPKKSGEIFSKKILHMVVFCPFTYIFAVWKKELTINN